MSLEETISKLRADDPIENGRRIAEQHRLLYHAPTGLLAAAERFHDGDADVFRSPDGVPVKGPVMCLQGGHTLVWDPTRFIELSSSEAELFAGITLGLTSYVAGCASEAADAGLEPKIFLHILRGALSNQLIAIEASIGMAGVQLGVGDEAYG